MQSGFSFFPERASTFAGEGDSIYVALIAISLFFGVLIFGALAFFTIRYRRRKANEVPEQIEGSLPLELIWSIVQAPAGHSAILEGGDSVFPTLTTLHVIPPCCSFSGSKYLRSSYLFAT